MRLSTWERMDSSESNYRIWRRKLLSIGCTRCTKVQTRANRSLVKAMPYAKVSFCVTSTALSFANWTSSPLIDVTV